MYKKILVPLDGSDLSASVLPYVRWIASTLRTPVELLHVEDVNRLAPYSPPLQIGYLDGIAESFSDGSDVKCTIERGSPAELIIRKAGAEPGVLVAMATHGYTGAARWLLGSVTQKALRGLHGDLLTVRPGAAGDRQAALETIIVPLDLSAAAEQVFAAVSDLARRLAVEILLVHVTKHVYTGPPDAFLPVFGAIPNLKELWEHDEAVGAAYLTEKVTELRARSHSYIEQSAAGRRRRRRRRNYRGRRKHSAKPHCHDERWPKRSRTLARWQCDRTSCLSLENTSVSDSSAGIACQFDLGMCMSDLITAIKFSARSGAPI